MIELMYFFLDLKKGFQCSKGVARDFLSFVKVSKETNPYVFSPEAQFAIKGEFFAGNLQFAKKLMNKDPDMKTITDLQYAEMIEVIQSNCPKITQTSHLHQTAFYKYLFGQFTHLADSVFLQNVDE
ncbi:hypothetical protein RFI_35604 [Reticulomyxa filosa]|uniref:Uncharacterized protein n=1 Tax=Reticulomyxa filosa TaxID=46433 RepID=X6LJQ0_RETFI|nr:hypothetical protein RFI_35604 [Reticulomyxa filosa]|eukprot:ETO01834.1 hypothetical protein RFI_35604 [Reticulomyxa filosa]